MVIGIGIDVVETARLARALERCGARFVDRVYTRAERADAAGRSDLAAALAGRFAAKEALLKALGTGFRGMSLLQVEVVRKNGAAPRLELSGAAAEHARRQGVRRLHLSVSHEAGLAVAMVILED
jgi:holo-[acyl-carrier protein] synthase